MYVRPIAPVSSFVFGALGGAGFLIESKIEIMYRYSLGVAVIGKNPQNEPFVLDVIDDGDFYTMQIKWSLRENEKMFQERKFPKTECVRKHFSEMTGIKLK